MDRRIVERPVTSPWIRYASFSISLVILLLTDEIGMWWKEVLIVIGAVSVLSFLGARLDVFLFGRQVIITDNGVETTGRIGAKITPWNEIIQVGSMHQDWADALLSLWTYFFSESQRSQYLPVELGLPYPVV